MEALQGGAVCKGVGNILRALVSLMTRATPSPQFNCPFHSLPFLLAVSPPYIFMAKHSLFPSTLTDSAWNTSHAAFVWLVISAVVLSIIKCSLPGSNTTVPPTSPQSNSSLKHCYKVKASIVLSPIGREHCMEYSSTILTNCFILHP